MSLSDALNPFITQSRSRSSPISYSDSQQAIAPPPPQYVPHRSELELAISEPPPPPPRTRVGPSANGVHAVQELLRIVSATRESQEIERKRRLAWEQEQEGKYTLRQAEMERQMFEMRQEINALKASINVDPSAPSGLLPLTHHSHRPASPISPVSQPSSNPLSQIPANFVQGSSTQHMPNQRSVYNGSYIEPQPPHSESTEPPAITPSPSPQLHFVEPSLLQSGAAAPHIPIHRRKRHTPNVRSSEGGDSSDSGSGSSHSERPPKRVNHHDTRCLTIHHAMRTHMLRLMDLETDKNLPDSHVEGVTLEDDEPVRFVWDKTTKQSVHNARMKTRVLADLKAKRKLYKHVPDKDFNKKVLESTFDQSFTTFRQKFKAQRDAQTALAQKKKEDSKALKARRISRRKLKLNSRAEARMKIEVFEHVTFDGALQVECMSSEESDSENPTPGSSGILRTRGYAWRSSRLQKFYSTLDDEELGDKIKRPKRGAGKKERCTGPVKEGFHLPPTGVASWMISRRWLNSARATHPDLPDVLKNIVVDPPGFDWNQFHALGVESDDSDDDTHMQNTDSQNMPQFPTSSLHYALV